jgi:hypothetical protein
MAGGCSDVPKTMSSSSKIIIKNCFKKSNIILLIIISRFMIDRAPAAHLRACPCGALTNETRSPARPATRPRSDGSRFPAISSSSGTSSRAHPIDDAICSMASTSRPARCTSRATSTLVVNKERSLRAVAQRVYIHTLARELGRGDSFTWDEEIKKR